MISEKQYELIAKSLSGNITGLEQAMLDQWLAESPGNARAFDEARRAWELAAQHTVVADTDAAWQKLHQSIAESSQQQKPRTGTWVMRVAAAVVLLVGIGYLFTTVFNQPVTMRTIASVGETLKVTLPDSSVVWLNRGSSIAFAEGFKGDTRKVQLTGEAFFDVVHRTDQPFVITAGSTTITDIGTSFNVRAYEGEKQVEVSVATGIVEFADNKQNKVTLNEGYHAVYNTASAKMLAEKNESANYMAWKTGQLVFEKNTLSQVAATLGRYYNTSIAVDSTAATMLFTGSFNHATIGEAMQILETSTGVEVNKQQNGYSMSAR